MKAMQWLRNITRLSSSCKTFSSFTDNTSSKFTWKSTGVMQQTLSGTVTRRGIGLHSGVESTVKLMPAMAGEGRYFVVNGEEEKRISACAANVCDTTLSTCLGQGSTRVCTVEHLLSALEGMGIDNCRMEIQGGDEVPLLDGSSMEWVKAIEEIGKSTAKDFGGSSIEKMARVLTSPMHVFKNDSFITAFPASYSRLTYGINFPEVHEIGCQWFSWSPTAAMTYKAEIAPSRTFAIYEQIQKLRSDGLIKGGSLENALVCSISKGWLNPPLRFFEEPCRHKLLDLIGDISLSAKNGHQGLPIAHIVAYKAGHALHVDFVRAFQKS